MFRIGNEPDCFLPFEYLWVGHPFRTPEIIRQTLKQFHDEIGRPWIPGNDDAGTLSAWYIFGVAGFYPNAGTDVYLIGVPYFPKVIFTLGNGKKFSVTAKNLFPMTRNIYIQSATLNGKPLNQAWFRHGDIKNGGKLILSMGNKPSVWGKENPPPSGAELIYSPDRKKIRKAHKKA